MKTHTVYQVLNGSKFPASGSFDDLAIFEREQDAKNWITYLTTECDCTCGFTVVKRRLLCK